MFSVRDAVVRGSVSYISRFLFFVFVTGRGEEESEGEETRVKPSFVVAGTSCLPSWLISYFWRLRCIRSEVRKRVRLR